MRTPVKWITSALALGAATYAASIAVTWIRYGRAKASRSTEDADALLDLFMPDYEVAERHHVRVAAPASLTHAAACEISLDGSLLVRTMMKTRETILGGAPQEKLLPRPLIDQLTDLGWSILAEIPDREVVLGTVTQPWYANVVFRPIPPADFAAFNEPGYVKIITTLRADPLGPDASIARTETRVATNDATAREKFRFYWSCFRPGIVLIRRVLLNTVKQEAERLRKEKLARAYLAPHASQLS